MTHIREIDGYIRREQADELARDLRLIRTYFEDGQVTLASLAGQARALLDILAINNPDDEQIQRFNAEYGADYERWKSETEPHEAPEPIEVWARG